MFKMQGKKKKTSLCGVKMFGHSNTGVGEKMSVKRILWIEEKKLAECQISCVQSKERKIDHCDGKCLKATLLVLEGENK